MPSNRLSRHLRACAYNNAWANHRLLRACAQLTQADFEAPRTGFFPSIKATLNHILTVDWFYIDALDRNLRGEPPHPDYQSFFRPEEPFANCAELWAAQRASDQRLIDYTSQLSDDALNDIVVIARIDHEQRDTRERLLAHVFEHQIHHRGQVHAMLSSTPVAPPQLDEFFCASEAPLRRQDFAELGWTEEEVWPTESPSHRARGA
ncbi:DinB family protein [Pseudoduganella sp. RAF53_2]|uniref:DinB family protein n=1 Tax=unclassified Pseudoduganella TaxID=2637179 RepID=UPI003F991E6B